MIATLIASLVVLSNFYGRVEADSLGAIVLSYVPAGGEEVFFRQAAPYDPSGWYHGGVPVCWPWFGGNGEPGSVLHGFARQREWRVVSRTDGGKDSAVHFRLEEPGEYRLDYLVGLNERLSLRLTMENLGTASFAVTTGLHPYFSVSHPENVAVATPSGTIRCHGTMNGGRPLGRGGMS